MTQHHPQDQFDEVPPYEDGRIGKHRAAAPAPERRGGGALRWVTLLAVFALLVGAFSYFVVPRLPEDWVPFAGDDAAEQEAEPSGEASGAADDESGEGSSDGEEAAEETPTAADAEAPVQIIDAGLPEGGLDDVEAQLAEMQYNVTNTAEWQDDWGEVQTPVIYYPSGQQEHAQDLAETFGVETVEENDNWSFVALVVGDEQAE
ncbi:LytR C-terminal domain-containing protein [Nesterenkonia sp. F]|uniref:LytR C-terminal domain-containing protein n=1 Tax=Nesterenkonia sp. F TaxID=795955 RepID=UPI000255D10E|nr:LytR C-terminal domain-containing protein [Nesterenkonia sp. F]